MKLKLLHSALVRVTIMTFVLLAVSLVSVVEPAAAQVDSGEIVIGLQNDMTDMNQWNPSTNTVWKTYQIGDLNFESLMGTDLEGDLFPFLADPARSGGTGFLVHTPPMAPDAATVDVYIRPTVTFTDGTPMTADDVVFSYQTQGWGTYSSFINEALWWDNPRFAHWTGGAAVSHIGVEKIDATTVRFHLSKTYALFFVATLGVLIMPKHVWTSHIDPEAPLHYTLLTPITDSADRSIDFAFGTSAGDISATIGTGPWKLVSWSRNQGSRVEVSPTYWGKDRADAGVTTGGVRYNFYPANLRSIRFVIYTSLDVISLALQSGEIDTLIWSLSPGFLQQVRFNPAISVEPVTDSGMFYMSFNLRRKPWNDLDLRKGISMAIDKDYIVNTLMGGFGIKGSVPHSIVRPEYTNQTAAPPSFDIEGAKAFLTSKGIYDRDGDGFREYKDGSPIRTAILTPPKDYDPVRADSGIMISNNLKKIGLNIDSAPTSFDTIVAKAFLPPVDFDIYILGFLLGTLPEAYLKDFFGGTQDVNLNPAGSNSAGYHNAEVDAMLEQMLVTLDNTQRIQIVQDIVGRVVNDLPWNILYYRKNLNAFRNDRWQGWVNTPPQIYNFWSRAVLHRPGVSVPELPSGAISVAMTAPERAIAGGSSFKVDVFGSQRFAPASQATVWLNTTIGPVTTTQQATSDIRGHATFTVAVPFIQGDIVATATVVKGASSGTTTKVIQVAVKDPIPIARLDLSTTMPVIGAGPGQTTQVIASVTDSVGAPVSGALVKIDTTLVFGSIAPASGTTDASGRVVFTYTAPINATGFPNQHLLEVLKANTTMTGTRLAQHIVPDVLLASLLVWVENDDAPDWLIANVSALDLVLNTAIPGDSVPVTVTVTDFAGAPVQDVEVSPVLPASESGIFANVTVTPTAAGSNVTDAAGLAFFTVTKTAAAVIGNVPIRFSATGTAYQVSDMAGLLITDGVAKGYAALVDFSDPSITSSPVQTTTVTTTMWDQTGAPATDGSVIYQIAPGSVGMEAQFPFAYDYANGLYLGEGLDLNYFDYGGSFGPSFESSVGQGSGFGADNAVNDWETLGYPNLATGDYIDSCDTDGFTPTLADPTPRPAWPADFEGFYLVNATGAKSQTILPAPHKGDSAVQVRAFIGSTAAASRLRLNITACGAGGGAGQTGPVFPINPGSFFGWGVARYDSVEGIWTPGVENAAFMIDSGMVIQRAPVITLGSLRTDQPILSSKDRMTKVTATFYARDGAPASDAQVFLLRGAGTGARNVGDAVLTRSGAAGTFGTLTTNATGVLQWDVAEQYTICRSRAPERGSTEPGCTPLPGGQTPVPPNRIFPTQPFSLSQGISYSFLSADPRYAYGGRHQLMASPDYLGDYYLNQFLFVLLAKIPMEFTLPYAFLPDPAIAYARVSVDQVLVPEFGTANVTVTVTDGTGASVPGATVWTGPVQGTTNETGVAVLPFTASLGSVENLVLAQTPDGFVVRAWYGIQASRPVLTYGSISVDEKTAGSASTISLTVTNTLPVAGPATVTLVVDGVAVESKTITIGAGASQTVSFDYVFRTAGDHSVRIESQSTTATIPAVPPLGFLEAYGLGIGLLVAGVVVGAVVGMLLGRRGRPPRAAESMAEEMKPGEEL